MTARARFTQADVTRAYRGAVYAGMAVSRMEICPVTGRIVVVAGMPSAIDPKTEPNEWDVALGLTA